MIARNSGRMAGQFASEMGSARYQLPVRVNQLSTIRAYSDPSYDAGLQASWGNSAGTGASNSARPTETVEPIAASARST
jgi:hypothetical protein